MASLPPVIAWDYQFAPNAQKSRNYLYATKTPFKVCEQPFFIPRPILRNLGITYRRVPVLSIGKDVFPDNASFIDAMQSILEKQSKGLKRSPADRSFEAWGYRSFWVALPCVPVEFNNKQLQNDRKDLFPLFGRADYSRLQTNAASELRSLIETVENDFLAEGPWIAGQECGLADIHAMWMLKWAMKTLDMEKQPGLGRDDWPKFYKWIESIPHHAPELEANDKIDEEEARKLIFGSEYAIPDIGIDTKDPLQYKAGDELYVEPTDAEPGQHPQHGKLVGLNTNKVVIELENGLRVHFPRIGYIIHRSADLPVKTVVEKVMDAVGLGQGSSVSAA
ncbi:hypothetical protein HII31_09524 [Pseudocercospora fuligena]|uniref:DUF7962 domain-containing protein n=1 Tax=Pseudocercospora fuligena TaxID=685502 RepID=A0A8H6VG04_9PEZI|nr:hypothetical protein HII31_09524 [Pseudocercospora fuligena]